MTKQGKTFHHTARNQEASNLRNVDMHTIVSTLDISLSNDSDLLPLNHPSDLVTNQSKNNFNPFSFRIHKQICDLILSSMEPHITSKSNTKSPFPTQIFFWALIPKMMQRDFRTFRKSNT